MLQPVQAAAGGDTFVKDTTTQAFVMSRMTGVVSSGLVESCVGCERSSDWLPSAATTVTPLCWANRIARCSA